MSVLTPTEPTGDITKAVGELMKGGAGAAEYAEKVFGPIPHVAAPGGGNVIQMHNPSAPAVPPMTGGKALPAAAVPAALLALAHVYGKTRRRRGGRSECGMAGGKKNKSQKKQQKKSQKKQQKKSQKKQQKKSQRK